MTLRTVAHQAPLFHGILQAGILEGVAMPSSRRSSWPRDRTCVSHVSCIRRQVLYHQCHPGSPLGHLMKVIIESKCSYYSVRSFSHVWISLCDPMDCNMPGFPIHHQLLEFAQTHVHWVSDAIQLSHPLSSPSPAFSYSQHQGLFQWASSSHQVATILELQL